MDGKSRIYKTLIAGGEISLSVLDTTALVNEAVGRHGLSLTAAAALGRTMTAAAYCCSWLKSERGALHVLVSGNGAGGKISVSGDAGLRMRGFLENPSADLPFLSEGKPNVQACVGRNGTLTVVRDEGEGLPVAGTSELVSGDIAEDFSAYFSVSEQRPTEIALDVAMEKDGTCACAGGMFLQAMPGASQESLHIAREQIARFPRVFRMIAARRADTVLGDLFSAAETARREISFGCVCSRERAAAAVASMGRADALALCGEEGTVSVRCPDCGAVYEFGESEILELFG